MVAKKTYGPKGVIAELWGGQTDQNAFWFKSGNDAVLNPLFKSGTLTKGPQQFVPDWLATNAGPIFAQMLVKTSNKIDGVIAANDNIAGAVIADLKARHLKPIPLSGQDASPQGVQYILAGWQTGTVYKYVPDEANAAAAGGGRTHQGHEAEDDHDQEERHQERADAGASGGLDHEGELHAALHGQVPEEERRLHRRLQAVLQVGRAQHAVEAPDRAPPPAFGRKRATVDDTPLLQLRGITKSFGSVQALTDVDFEVRRGEVMALVGDNGAGKSTLIKCVAGVQAADSGEILFEGQEVHIHGPKDAAKLGIEVVYQDLALCDNLDVVQNMYLGREVHDWLQRLKEPIMEQKTAETLKSLAVTTINSIRQPVATLSGGQRQSVAVAKAVQWNSKLVILDEPTAALGVAQTEQVLALVRRLAEQGLAVVVISHNLHDIFETAARITVLRLGRTVGIFERAKTTQQEVVEAITAGVPTKVSGIPATSGATP